MPRALGPTLILSACLPSRHPQPSKYAPTTHTWIGLPGSRTWPQAPGRATRRTQSHRPWRPRRRGGGSVTARPPLEHSRWAGCGWGRMLRVQGPSWASVPNLPPTLLFPFLRLKRGAGAIREKIRLKKNTDPPSQALSFNALALLPLRPPVGLRSLHPATVSTRPARLCPRSPFTHSSHPCLHHRFLGGKAIA